MRLRKNYPHSSLPPTTAGSYENLEFYSYPSEILHT